MLNGIEEIEGLTPEQIEAINERASGLATKNQQLLDKLSQTKEKVEESNSAAERLKALEAKLEREQAESSQNYQKALELKEQEYQSTVSKIEQELKELRERDRYHTVDSVLKSELAKMQVNPDLLDLVSSQISSQAQVVEGQALIGDKSLSDYLAEWAETPQGKAVTLAPNNSGTGTLGQPSKNGSNASWGDYTATQLSAIRSTNPDEYNRLKETR